MATHRRSASTILWIVTTLVVILLLTRNLISAGIGGGVLLLAQTVLLTVFTLLHGSRRYGWRAILVYYAVTLLVSNSLENLSVLTGFPFGNYHYTTGPQLFLVPLAIGPFYAAIGYLAWTIATLLVGEVRRASGWLTAVGTPLVASLPWSPGIWRWIPRVPPFNSSGSGRTAADSSACLWSTSSGGR